MKTAYDLLGTRPDADDETIRKAFREAAKLHHPDLRPDDPDAPARFRKLAGAYAVLRDPEQRAAYDQLLAIERQRARWTWARAVSEVVLIAVLSSGMVAGYVWIKPLVSTSVMEVDGGTARAARQGTVPETPMAAAGSLARSPAGAGAEGTGGAGEANAEQAGQPDPTTSATHAPDAAVIANLAPRPRPDDIEPASAPSAPAHGHADVAPEVAKSDAAKSDAAKSDVLMSDAVKSDTAGRPGPADSKAAPRLADVRGTIDDPDRALAVYDAAIRIIPNSPLLFHDRGLMWRRKGELDRALADLDRAIRFDFSDANFYNDRGLIWLEKGNYNRAIADFERASQIDPTLSDAAVNRDIARRRETDARGGTDIGRVR
jgi:curved DNA-binding protein CbpA